MPQYIKIIRKIADCINKHFTNPETKVNLNSSELYEIIIKVNELKIYFENQKSFNQFLRKYHDDGAFKQYINFSVDKTIHEKYRWVFNAKNNHHIAQVKTSNTKLIEGDFNSNQLYNNKFAVKNNEGFKFDSKQEEHIYKALICEDNLVIERNKKLKINDITMVPDFIISNNNNGKKFIWEHFGYVICEDYKNKIAIKIEAYEKQLKKSSDKYTKVLYTYYHNENNFYKLVAERISLITEK